MKPGNLVHRKSSLPVFGAIIGHAGVVVESNRIVDCNVGRGRASVREIPLNEFIAGEEFWGERELPGITGQQRKGIAKRAREIANWVTEYDDLHNNQKGEWFDRGTADEYWEADCVGLAEHCYEHVGADIVGNEGVLLTVPEQRDAMQLVNALTSRGRANLFASWIKGELNELEFWQFHQEFPSDLLENAGLIEISKVPSIDANDRNSQIVRSSVGKNLITEAEADLVDSILSD